MERERAIVSSPEISSARVLRSVWSALPRMEPRAFWKNPSVGASDILRSRARRRERLADSMSCVAWRPASLRARSASVTGLGREPKVCQGELTEAKPDRRDMMEIPITPTRSRQDWVRDWWVDGVGERLRWFRSHEPLHQNPRRYAVKPTVWSTHASRRRPFPLPVYSYPAAEMEEWISKKGIAMIRKKRSSVTVMRRAPPRAMGLIVFEMSHSISSASTAASAIVEEKANADKRLKLNLAGGLLKLFDEWLS